MYALLQISNTRHHVATHSQINIISSSLNIDYNNYTVATCRWLLWLLTQVTTLIINLEDLAVKQAHEQSGLCAEWLARLDSVDCVVSLSAAVTVYNPSFKMQREPLRARWSSGKSATRHNSVRGE